MSGHTWGRGRRGGCGTEVLAVLIVAVLCGQKIHRFKR